MMVTFIFVLYILHVTGKHTGAPDLGVWGVPSICLILWAMCQVDAFTYASLNPALAIGSFVMQVTWYPYNPQGVLTHYMWQYLIGASLGGILAGIFYHMHEKLFIHDDDCSSEASYTNRMNKLHDHEAEFQGKKMYE